MDPAIARSSAVPASFQAQQSDRAGARAREDAATSASQAGFQPDLSDSAVFTPVAIAAADQAMAGRDRKGDPAKLLGARDETPEEDGGQDGEDEQTGRRTSTGSTPLTADEQQMVAELAARDREVRAHEAAHMGAGGALAGGASFSYEKGPDGRSYAIGGEVSIDTGSESTPQATIAKMQQVRRAALAPAQPSSQDRSVAAAASQAEAAARQQLAASRDAQAGEGAGGADQAEERPEEPKAADGAPGKAPTSQGRQAVEAYQRASGPQRQPALALTA